jgi:hypothetical protein
MKKSIITLILVLIIGTSFAQNYQVVRKIVATPDCRTRFLNSQNVQIFEVNSFDMTYNFLSNTQLQIRDYKNSVTIYKVQTSSPIFDSLPSFLDSIKTACLIFSDTAGIFGVVAGNNITIDNSNIKFPIINASGGGGSTYLAKNGIYIDSDTIKLGGNITEDTKLDNPNSKSIQIGSDGDAMNLNVVPPIEFNEFLASFSGFDYQDEHMKTVFGIIKDIVFQDFGFDSTTMVGSFTIAGNPFDSISPDGSIFIDGIFYDSESDIVGQKKFIITFLGGDLTLTANEQSDLDQIINIVGNYANQSQVIEGNNATQDKIIIGNNATQYQAIQGEDGVITRQVLDSANGNYFTETITASKIVTVVDTAQIKAQIIGFFDSIGVSQPLVPLGSSTNDVITALQSLGLFRED